MKELSAQNRVIVHLIVIPLLWLIIYWWCCDISSMAFSLPVSKLLINIYQFVVLYYKLQYYIYIHLFVKTFPIFTSIFFISFASNVLFVLLPLLLNHVVRDDDGHPLKFGPHWTCLSEFETDYIFCVHWTCLSEFETGYNFLCENYGFDLQAVKN